MFCVLKISNEAKFLLRYIILKSSNPYYLKAGTAGFTRQFLKSHVGLWYPKHHTSVHKL
jgi:hypothetical protein